MSKVTKSVEFPTGPVLFEYDSESTHIESVRIGDLLTAFLFTLDDAHKFHSHLTDFLAQAREIPQRPTHAGMQAFVDRVQKDPADSPSTIP